MPEKTDRELLQETHDAVIALKEQVKTLFQKTTDQEKRIRVLEKYGAVLIGAGIIIQLILSKIQIKF